jgi:acetyl esterase/lipase
LAPLPIDPLRLNGTAMPTLNVFRPAQPDGRALLVCPGGSYEFASIGNEGLDVAERLLPMGFTLFVLRYRLPAEGWKPRADVPLQDAQRAMRWIRAHAAALGVDTARLGVLGFSAGGHLAATLATRHREAVYVPVDAADRESARPDYAGLVYPVVAMGGPFVHEPSCERLLGPDPSAALMATRSAELLVDAQTPPCFIVHAFDDADVVVDNSLLMLQALRDAGRPVEAHLFEAGGHGFGVGPAGLPCARWPELFDDWVRSREP